MTPGLRARLASLSRETLRSLRGHDLALYSAAVTFYAGIAIVPALLVGLRLASLLLGQDRVSDLAERGIALLPDAMSAQHAAQALVQAGVGLSALQAVAALLPASLYGEGLRRAFVSLTDADDTLVGWRGRLALLPVLAAVPLMLIIVLLVTPVLSRLVYDGAPVAGLVLGVWISLTIDWIALSLPLSYVYQAVGRGSPGWRASLSAGFFTGAFISGFLQGFVVFLAIPVDLGAPFGGLTMLGGTVAVALWLYLLHTLVLVGYALCVRLGVRWGDFREPEDLPTPSV